jgi:phage-related protein
LLVSANHGFNVCWFLGLKPNQADHEKPRMLFGDKYQMRFMSGWNHVMSHQSLHNASGDAKIRLLSKYQTGKSGHASHPCRFEWEAPVIGSTLQHKLTREVSDHSSKLMKQNLCKRPTGWPKQTD